MEKPALLSVQGWGGGTALALIAVGSLETGDRSCPPLTPIAPLHTKPACVA